MIVHTTPLRFSTPGTRREVTSLVYGAASGGPSVYLQAALHADEVPALLAASVLRTRLEALEAAGRLRGRVTLVPVANPIGLGQHLLGQSMGCFELASGRNFNRGIFGFAGLEDRLAGRLGADAAANRRVIVDEMRNLLAERAPASELDALHGVLQGLAVDADIVLDLHCSLEAVVHLYTGEAAWPRIEPLARRLGSQAQLLSDDSGRGGFSEWANATWARLRAAFGGSCALPEAAVSATLELGGEREVSHAAAQAHAQAIVDYLVDVGTVAGEPTPLPPLRHPATRLDDSVSHVAPASGVLVYRANVGDVVRRGDPLCDIVDPSTSETTTVTSGGDGLFYMRRAIRFVMAGAEIGRVTGVGPGRTTGSRSR